MDGKWVLTSNTQLPARELALKYKQLWLVEALFRTAKSQLDTRPIFHQCDDTIRGRVFCSFLALLLRVELEERLARRGWKLEWADIVADLDRLQEIDLNVNGKAYRLRTEAQGHRRQGVPSLRRGAAADATPELNAGWRCTNPLSGVSLRSPDTLN